MRSVPCMLSLLTVSGGLLAAPVRITEGPERIALASAAVEAAFGTARSGGLLELRAAGEPNRLVPAGSWFGVVLWVDGKGEIRLSSQDALAFTCRARHDAEAAVIDAEAMGFPERNGVDLAALRIHVAARLEPGSEALRWRCTAEVPAGVHLQRFDAPVVQFGLPFGSDGADDAVVIGHPKGGVCPNPEQWKTGTSAGGVLSAQFGCVYDAAGGIMTLAEDGAGYEKWLSAQRTQSGLQLGWRHAVAGTGSVRIPYDTVLRPFRGSPETDWRDAADLYRAWAVQQPWCERPFAARPDIPSWMKSGPTMLRFARNWLATPEMIELWFSRYWDAHFAGVPFIVTFWGWEQHGSWVAPDYFPPYPSAEGFAAAVRSVRRRGGHVFLWPSGYHWTVSFRKQADDVYAWDDRERFAEVGTPHVSLDAAGKPRIGPRSWLDGGSNASLCPGDPWTRQWFADICTGCLDIGADMIQVDQVVRGAFPDCFSMNHGHPPGGGLWKTAVVAEQLRGLLALGLARTPDFVLGIEEPQEWFNHLVGIQDYRDFEVVGRRGQVPAQLPASVYGYLYHDYLPVFQSNPRGDDPVCQAYCLVTGQMPHLVPTSRVCYDSLLLNGGFEEWNGSVPRHWDKVGGWQGEVWTGSCDRDAEAAAEGEACLVLRNGEGQTVQVSQNIPVGRHGLVPGKAYRLAVKLRTAGLEPGNTLNLGALGTGLKGLAGWRIPLPASTEGAWQDAEVEIVMPPEAVVLRIMLHLRGAGQAWIDDLRLETQEGAGPPPRPLPSDHELMVQWSRLYHGAGRPWLFLGRMLRPPRLETALVPYNDIMLPAVFHNAFRSPAGEDAVILANATDAVQAVVLHAPAAETLSLQPFEVRLLRLSRQ